MKQIRLVSLFLLAACQTGAEEEETEAIADEVSSETGCTGDEPDPAMLAELEPFANPELSAEETPDELARAGKTRIDVIFHVIRRKAGGAGDHPRARLEKTIAFLNETYGKSRFRFRLKAITRTTSPTWYAGFDNGSRIERRAKRRLHRGNAETLNIYTANGDGSWGKFPWDQAGAPKMDGIVVKNDGGARDTTYPHEVGHWLGLLHTHQGGCSTPGDHVADTPAEADVSFIQACTGQDSCPSLAGNDPIHNFMAYTSCRDRFTRGQRHRASFMWDRYRELCRPIPVCTADAKAEAAIDLDYSALPSDDGEAWPETTVELVDGV